MSNKTQYTPAEGFLICEPIEGEASQHLTIQDEGFEQKSKVLAVGKDTYYPNTNISLKAPAKVGDEIIHSSIGWENFRILGQKYRIVPFQKVVAVKK